MQILNCNELASNWLRLETFIFSQKVKWDLAYFKGEQLWLSTLNLYDLLAFVATK